MITRFFPILTKLKALKTHGRMLWHAFRHADTPKWIKGFMLAVVVYLFSPIDLIPDFLVLFGITDDLVVISAAMWFLGKVVPEKVKNSLPMDQTDSQVTSTDNTQQVKKNTVKAPHCIACHTHKNKPSQAFRNCFARWAADCRFGKPPMGAYAISEHWSIFLSVEVTVLL
ncbi:MAG: DUF1232 domain-containing protein [Gammaproteobacteria bacterium]|nr:DUF1232 domain-containing protein [Gammaproteobacteria bacterium]